MTTKGMSLLASLLTHPQGPPRCQRIPKNILQTNLLSYCAKIYPKLKKVQKKTSKMTSPQDLYKMTLALLMSKVVKLEERKKSQVISRL